MWRRERAAVRSSQAEGLSAASVVATVVLVPVVALGLVSVCFEIAAAAAAVVRPRNASRSPQARIERRNLFLPKVDCKSEAERAGIRPGRAPLGAAYAIGLARVTVATFVACKGNACNSAIGHFGPYKRRNVRRCDKSCVKQRGANGNADRASRGS